MPFQVTGKSDLSYVSILEVEVVRDRVPDNTRKMKPRVRPHLL